jgi:hypothetical protein
MSQTNGIHNIEPNLFPVNVNIFNLSNLSNKIVAQITEGQIV